MKRIFRFLITFLICLIAAYFYPVVFPQKTISKNTPIRSSLSTNRVSVSPEVLPQSGFVKYIGVTKADFELEFGMPKDTFSTPLGAVWTIYGDETKDYFQVLYRDEKVSSIFSLGLDNPIEPFEIGEDLSAISESVTIYSNFFLKDKGQEYEIELTEEDMNCRPLIAFEDNRFAILHISQADGRLMSVRYLDMKSLLELMPYQLIEGSSPELEIANEFDWRTYDEKNRAQFRTILSILRERENLEPYHLVDRLNTVTENSLRSFIEDPSKLLTPEELTEWEIHVEYLSFYMPVSFGHKKINQLLKAENKEFPDVSGGFYSPAYDVPWLTMALYNERDFQGQFKKNADDGLGVSFYKDAALFITLNPNKVKFEMTETSDTKEK